jgi:hypothetical protein
MSTDHLRTYVRIVRYAWTTNHPGAGIRVLDVPDIINYLLLLAASSANIKLGF